MIEYVNNVCFLGTREIICHLIFELWIIGAHIRTLGVRGTRFFFSHRYTSTDRSEEGDSRAYIVKEFVHVRGRVAYAWTALEFKSSTGKNEPRSSAARHDIRERGAVVRGNEKCMKVNFIRGREERTRISVQKALVSNTAWTEEEKRDIITRGC